MIGACILAMPLKQEREKTVRQKETREDSHRVVRQRVERVHLVNTLHCLSMRSEGVLLRLDR